jgi:hypothetical protein
MWGKPMDSAKPDDGELARHALSGSKEAFGRLYDRYFDYILTETMGEGVKEKMKALCAGSRDAELKMGSLFKNL